jgi:hypothetical protein
MFSVAFAIAVSLTLTQTPPANQACTLLTPAQVSSLIGAPAQTLPVSAAPTGSTCMFQNNDKMVTVLMSTLSAVDAAQGLFDAKKRIASGADVPGWGVPAYAGTMQDVAIVGVLMKQTFTEVKVIDKTQQPAAMAAKLKTVMKEVAAKK